MPNPLQSAADSAMMQLPYAFSRLGTPKILPSAPGSDSQMRAGVEEGNAVSPIYVGDASHWTNPDYTPQLLRHEMTHQLQNNWPQKIQNALPPVNPSDPYNYGGTAGLQKIGGDPTKMSREESAAAEQEIQAMQQRGEKIPSIYKTFDQNLAKVPLSVMQPTDPNQAGINTMARTPGLPAGYDSATGKILHADGVKPVPKGSSQAEDPWTQAAAEYAKSGISAPAQANESPNEDWKLWGSTGNAQSQPEQSTLQKIGDAADNFGQGVGKSVAGLVTNTSDLLHKIPYVGPKLIPEGGLQTMHAYTDPVGTAQKVGRGVGDAAQFLIPGLGEEAAGAKLAELAPGLGEAATPLARIGTQALGSGVINKAQGGGFGTGVAAGAAGAGIGEGMKALAPGIAESAMKIRKLDRAYGKTPGRAILDETSGVRPGTVAESAQSRLNELNPQLEKIATAASSRPANPIRGFLQAPPIEIPLGDTPGPGEMPGGLLDAQPFPPQNVGEARVIRNPKGQILPRAARNVEFPDESGRLPFGRNPKGQILSRVPTRQAWMTGAEDEIPNAPGVSGPGVLLRRMEIPDEPIAAPTTQPNRIASLAPARGIVGSATGKATAQNAEKEVGQLQPMAKFLHQRFDTGEAIPSQVTPKELLDLRRGFGSEFVHNWNPETMPGVTGTARNAYHALAHELHTAAPETADIDRRISSLIPVAKRAASTDLNADTGQRILGRIGAHTGAATLGGLGAVQGYREDGVAGGILGGAAGIAVPELLASPTGQMALARTLNSTKVIPKALVGGALQANR